MLTETLEYLYRPLSLPSSLCTHNITGVPTTSVLATPGSHGGKKNAELIPGKRPQLNS